MAGRFVEGCHKPRDGGQNYGRPPGHPCPPGLCPLQLPCTYRLISEYSLLLLLLPFNFINFLKLISWLMEICMYVLRRINMGIGTSVQWRR